jgi:hypothetical protein
VQQAAPRLIDTADDSRDILQSCRDGRLHGHVELAATNTMTDHGCRRLGLLEVASRHDYRVIGRQLRRDTLADNAIATCDEDALLSHGVGPSDQWRSG